jgi:hypothetical protein
MKTSFWSFRSEHYMPHDNGSTFLHREPPRANPSPKDALAAALPPVRGACRAARGRFVIQREPWKR